MKMESFQKKFGAWVQLIGSLSPRRDLIAESSVPIILHGSTLLRSMIRDEPNDCRLRFDLELSFQKMLDGIPDLYDGRALCNEINNTPFGMDNAAPPRVDLLFKPLRTVEIYQLPLTVMTPVTADALYKEWATIPSDRKVMEYNDRTRVQIVR